MASVAVAVAETLQTISILGRYFGELEDDIRDGRLTSLAALLPELAEEELPDTAASISSGVASYKAWRLSVLFNLRLRLERKNPR